MRLFILYIFRVYAQTLECDPNLPAAVVTHRSRDLKEEIRTTWNYFDMIDISERAVIFHFTVIESFHKFWVGNVSLFEAAFEAEPVSVPEGETEPEGEIEPEGETEPEEETGPEGETEPEGKTEPEGEGDIEPGGEIEPEGETESEGETEPERESKSGT